ncbi:MAG: sialate O-acetylesterase [Bacteroidales bacterium]|nr:sialate O-acetylesterase [Bacteroidales bacterium]
MQNIKRVFPSVFLLGLVILLHPLLLKSGSTISIKSLIPENLEIFLLIGQSNMAGRAEIQNQDCDTLENVFLFIGINEQAWEKASNPLNKYSSVRKELSMQKLGPGYTFAKKISQKMQGKRIGLIVNARGGTSIDEWLPGKELYKEAISRTNMALKNGSLKGVIWLQGESDMDQIDAYPEKLSVLVNGIRDVFDIKDLPFVAAQLSEDKPERKAFNQMLLRLPEKITQMAVVQSDSTKTFMAHTTIPAVNVS